MTYDFDVPQAVSETQAKKIIRLILNDLLTEIFIFPPFGSYRAKLPCLGQPSAAEFAGKSSHPPIPPCTLLPSSRVLFACSGETAAKGTIPIILLIRISLFPFFFC
jgi:hypothetical protein